MVVRGEGRRLDTSSCIPQAGRSEAFPELGSRFSHTIGLVSLECWAEKN